MAPAKPTIRKPIAQRVARWLGACVWLVTTQSCVGPDLEPPDGRVSRGASDGTFTTAPGAGAPDKPATPPMATTTTPPPTMGTMGQPGPGNLSPSTAAGARAQAPVTSGAAGMASPETQTPPANPTTPPANTPPTTTTQDAGHDDAADAGPADAGPDAGIIRR